MIRVTQISGVESIETFVQCVQCHRRLLQPNSNFLQCNKCGHDIRLKDCPRKNMCNSCHNTESRLHLRERLFGDKLEKALTTIFEEYSTDVVIKKLAPASNSQRNEALNSVVSSKAPKSRYYGGSESNNFRVACGVGQTNEGSKYMYVPQVIKEIGLKAGEH